MVLTSNRDWLYNNRYLRIHLIDIERKNRLLKVYGPTTSATFLAFFLFFLAAAINSINEANKAGGTHTKQSILLRCL